MIELNQLPDQNLAPKQPAAGVVILKNIGSFLLDLIKIVVVCAAIIIPIRYFLVQPFYVKGASMEPNFHDGEYLIIYQLPYQLNNIFNDFTENARGKTLVIHPPDNSKDFYIKRLIGLPGEKIKIAEGNVYIYNINHPEGFLLDESSYLPPGVNTIAGTEAEIKLTASQVYVLGDNRAASLDSRRIGPIPIKNIIGQTVFRGWPVDKVGIISQPKYNDLTSN